MPRKKKQKINNLIVVSDLHCGCQFGLCPDQVTIDGGGVYRFSPLQEDIYHRWNEFWYEWVPQVTKGEPFAVVCNGDAIDGSHHGSTTQISHNLTDQGKIAYSLLRPVVTACEGRYYHIRGTEAHVGQSGQEEERLAMELGAIPDSEGRYARWEMWIEVGNGLVHLSHHIGTAGSLAYETSAVHKELEQAFVEAARWQNRPPDVIVRSHRHRNVETRIQTYHGFATACTTAGWQAKTPFVYKIAGGRQTLPQIGGTLVRCGDEDLFTRHRLWNLARPKTETCYE
jgi:hypothetical protein